MFRYITYSNLCSRCFSITVCTKSSSNNYFAETCPNCGHSSSQYKVRDKSDPIKDVGKYRFITTYEVYGIVSVLRKDGQTSLAVVVDNSFIDSFIDDLILNQEYIASATLSYLNKDLKQIVKIELMQFL